MKKNKNKLLFVIFLIVIFLSILFLFHKNSSYFLISNDLSLDNPSWDNEEGANSIYFGFITNLCFSVNKDLSGIFLVVLFIFILVFLLIYSFKKIEKNTTYKKYKEIEKQIIQAQDLESLGLLVSGIVHDFNNLINIIYLNCDLLLKTCNEPKCIDRVHNILGALEKVVDFNNKLLSYGSNSRGGEPKKPYTIDEVWNDIYPIISSLLGKNIDIIYRTEGDLPEIMLEKSQIQKVFLNLACNSKDSIDSKNINNGYFSVYVKKSFSLDNPNIPDGEYISITVSDNGIGIPDSVKSKIFDPFFTTKEKGKGTGLGLMIVNDVIKKHGGFISVEGQEGSGATFKIYLPIEQNSKNK